MFYCVLFCVLCRKESANKQYRNTVNNLISPNTVSQNDEKTNTAVLDDTTIPHVKIKITKILHEKRTNTAIPSTPMSPSQGNKNKMSIRYKKKMNYYNSQSSHKKTTFAADNHLKLVTWMDKSIMFFQETKIICSSDHLPFLQYSYNWLERFILSCLCTSLIKKLITCIPKKYFNIFSLLVEAEESQRLTCYYTRSTSHANVLFSLLLIFHKSTNTGKY